MEGCAGKRDNRIQPIKRLYTFVIIIFFFSSRRRHTRLRRDWSSDVCSSDLEEIKGGIFLLISGLLLITPGFFTDCIGFAMFLKPVQNFVGLKARDYFQSRRRY